MPGGLSQLVVSLLTIILLCLFIVSIQILLPSLNDRIRGLCSAIFSVEAIVETLPKLRTVV